MATPDNGVWFIVVGLVCVLGAIGGFTLMIVLLVSHGHHHHNQGVPTLPNTSPPPHETVVDRLVVDLSQPGRPIPDKLFGIYLEEVNHAGAGGLWAELVSNRGFEAGGRHIPSDISPWTIIGNQSYIVVSTDFSSCFKNNENALRLDVICNDYGDNKCPVGGVGVFNPGFWGMNIEKGKTYKVVFHVRSQGSINLTVSFTTSNGTVVLASSHEIADAAKVANWTRMEMVLQAEGSYPRSRLQFTTNKKGTIWFDQISATPTETYTGHGFRKDLVEKIIALEPRFVRFPGGLNVDGQWLRNAFRWKETVGPWEQRPGHFVDVSEYWTDDGLGYFEFLQLAEDLDAAPVWVINVGISIREQVNATAISPYVQEMLDSIEFARGDPSSKWGSIRAAMGHPEVFDLKYVALGSDDCLRPHYQENYLQFYQALKDTYPDMQAITNCDNRPSMLHFPADLYDLKLHVSSSSMFDSRITDYLLRSSPKAFVTESSDDYGDKVDPKFPLAEAALLVQIERNSDVTEMACFRPLLMNYNDKTRSPGSLVFDSSRVYGTPNYYAQQFFAKSSGKILVYSKYEGELSTAVVVSAILRKNATGGHGDDLITIKVVNCATVTQFVKLSIVFGGTTPRLINCLRFTTLVSSSLSNENSFENPTKVSPSDLTHCNVTQLINQTTTNDSTRSDLSVMILRQSITSIEVNVSGTR